ncbi:hypothetical protein BKA66DRAFT_548639 [Pyrenochaeta sp. MPI-SDFR-AT-0127]|nr:hypothetical protein BKA66DRAFT_548639 [Pyrenochaeta sp. MPI-SDFR-AT-0127]
MDIPLSVLEQPQVSSFNPEAATFSPGHIAATPTGTVPSAVVVASPLPIVRKLLPGSTAQCKVLRSDITELKAHGKTDDSHLRPTENMYPDFDKDTGKSHDTVNVDNFPSRKLPANTLQKVLLGERPKSRPQVLRLNVDELSASLGLPGMKKNIDRIAGDTHQNHSSHDNPDVYGRLIGRALDKPLTAQALAYYLQSQTSISSDDITEDSRDLQASALELRNSWNEEEQDMKFVCPPPGFDGKAPRKIPVEERISGVSAVTEPRYVSTGPAVTQYIRHDNLLLPVNLQPYHTRRLSGKRRLWATNRVKRTDQGPEPSAADIYPDDAKWEPTYVGCHSKRAANHHRSFEPQVSSEREFHIENTIGWPTPAEVYAHKPLVPGSNPDRPFNIFENHVSPTAIDLNAADDEVIAMMDQLPDLSTDTIFSFGAFDLRCDEYAPTPSQLDGKRYSIRYSGLVLGNSWNPTELWEGEHTRIRPSIHSACDE